MSWSLDYANPWQWAAWAAGLSTLSSPTGPACGKFPPKAVIDDFIDTFVDYTVGGQRFVRSNPGTDAAPAPPTGVLPRAKRLVAIGDLHGDIVKTRAALRIGGLIDASDHWVGGTTVAVQVGDQLDRGPSEIHICLLLERLKQEAAAVGGRFVSMNGNHETMNAYGDFRYAGAGYAEFNRWKVMYQLGQRWKRGCELKTHPLLPAPDTCPPLKAARWQALQCGGPITRRFLAPQSTVVMVGSSLFAHGGILPEHIDAGVDHINREVQEWMLAPHGTFRPPAFIKGRNSIVWSRHFGHRDEHECDCPLLREVLAKAGAARLVVGHTIQDDGINAACDGTVYRIDVGMSDGCGGGKPQVLEIVDDEVVRILQ